MPDFIERLLFDSHDLAPIVARKKSSNKGKNEKKTRQISGIESVKRSLNYIEKDVLLANIETDDHRIDGYIDYGYLIWNKLFKTIPSETNYSGHYDLQLLMQIFTEGKLLARRCTDWDCKDTEDVQINYFFLYKKHVIHVCHHVAGHFLPGGDFQETPVVGGIWTWSNIDTASIFDDIYKYKIAEKPEKAAIGIIKQNKYGPYIGKIELNSDTTFSLDYYNEDFENYLINIQNQLDQNKPGLYLMHGEPGTGKSSAIRHLLSIVDREFIFVPPQMVHSLSTPEFTDILTRDHKGCVLILEDAEKALMKREGEDGFSNSTLVSSILNLTDGLYADLTQSAIIATYNCDRNLIDPALLRKGRLKSEYRYEKLDRDRSQSLMDKLGHNVDVEDPMTLADIFNFELQYSNNKESRKKRSVGFGG